MPAALRSDHGDDPNMGKDAHQPAIDPSSYPQDEFEARCLFGSPRLIAELALSEAWIGEKINQYPRLQRYIYLQQHPADQAMQEKDWRDTPDSIWVPNTILCGELNRSGNPDTVSTPTQWPMRAISAPAALPPMNISTINRFGLPSGYLIEASSEPLRLPSDEFSLAGNFIYKYHWVQADTDCPPHLQEIRARKQGEWRHLLVERMSLQEWRRRNPHEPDEPQDISHLHLRMHLSNKPVTILLAAIDHSDGDNEPHPKPSYATLPTTTTFQQVFDWMQIWGIGMVKSGAHHYGIRPIHFGGDDLLEAGEWMGSYF